eukprot:g19829.t1
MEAGRTTSRIECSCRDRASGSGSKGVIGRGKEAKARASIFPEPAPSDTTGNSPAAAGEERCFRHLSSSARDGNGVGSDGSGNRLRRTGLVEVGGRRGRGSGCRDTKSSGRGSLGGRDCDNGGRSRSLERHEPAAKSHGCLPAATAMKLITLLFALQNAALLWAQRYYPAEGRLCSVTQACVTSPVSMALLTVARLTAGALFPSITFCMLSKCYASKYILHHSWLTQIIDFEPTHQLHTYFGVLALICSVVHGGCHIARSAYESDPDWVVRNTMNRSGVAALLLLIVASVPMSVGFAKAKVKYEVRKTIHLLFIPFMVAACFHGKWLRLLGGALLAWYLVDRLYFTTKMTFLVRSPSYKSVGRGTLVRFDLPEGYKYTPGAYVQINCPAISASEWHPFSLFPVPAGPRKRAGFHVEAVGDWTEELFRLSLKNPRMSLWITAAQPSVVQQTVYYDNVVLVCTGAGITPAVSVAERFARKKNVHLLWLSRDSGMIAMFEKQLRLVRSSVYLTGNPTEETKKRMVDLLAPSRGDVVPSSSSSSRRPSLSATPPYGVDLAILESGGGGGGAGLGVPIMKGYRGVLREGHGAGGGGGGGGGGYKRSCFKEGGDDLNDGSDKTEQSPEGSLEGAGASYFATEDSADSARVAGGGTGREKKRSHLRRQARSHLQRARGYQPVTLNFGRPDIGTILAETIKETAVLAEWAPPAQRSTASASATRKFQPPPSASVPNEAPLSRGVQKTLSRLSTPQRVSKRDLMEADLSIVNKWSSKELTGATNSQRSLVSDPTTIDESHDAEASKSSPPADKGTWLVLYCGANADVERTVGNACDELKVKWRKEYFARW